MKHPSQVLSILISMLAMGVAACATDASGNRVTIVDDVMGYFESTEGLSPAQLKLREEANRHRNTRILGTLIGGIGGGVGGAFAADKLDVDPATGAVLGAAAGGLAGYAAGAYVAAQNEQYTNQQEALDARIVAAEADAERYKEAGAAARTVVAEQRAKIAELNDKYRRGELEAEAYRTETEKIEGDLKALKILLVESEGNVVRMQQDIDAFKKAGQGTQGLERAKRELEQENKHLRDQYAALVEAIDNIPDDVAPVVS